MQREREKASSTITSLRRMMDNLGVEQDRMAATINMGGGPPETPASSPPVYGPDP